MRQIILREGIGDYEMESPKGERIMTGGKRTTLLTTTIL